MKTYIFIQKNGSGVLTLSALNYEKAQEELDEMVHYPYDWRCEDEGGEDEDA